MVDLETHDFLIIAVCAALAALTVALAPRRLAPPVVVIELLLGIVIGPDVLDLVGITDFTTFFGNLGLGMLFFFAGYEIDFDRVKGQPLLLAGLGWLLSLALAYSIGGILAWAGVVLSLVFTGSALATTAIGTLIPVLKDAGEMETRFGTFLLAAGAAGEFGPILLISIVLSADSPIHNAVILLAFVALAVALGILSVTSGWRGWPVLERTLESSSQLAVRLAVVLVFGLVALASTLGLDLLLGGFAAGIVTRLALKGQEVAVLESKLTAIGYGFFVPFFFVTSGMAFDLESLLNSSSSLLKVPLFFVLFLVVRGVPALVLYRKVLKSGERLALAFFSATELPLVVAITTLAVQEHNMRPSTSAALVGAAILSTLIYPFIGLALRRRQRNDGGGMPEPATAA